MTKQMSPPHAVFSHFSCSCLLGTYMGGMCLGSLVLPRLIPPRFHPLRVYGCLELGIGLIAILVLYGMPYIADLYAGFYWHGVLVRTLVAAVCLIPPTLLMGATLPAVARFVESTPEGVSWMGFFYGGNIAGGVAGCLGAGFFLLRVFDMPAATYTAAAINVLVAVTALLIAKSSIPTPQHQEAATAHGVPCKCLVYIVAALSGLSALGAEVVWTRLLSLLLGATVYSFSIILAVFLVGLGIGSGAGSLLSRTCARPRLALAWCQMLLAAAAAWAAMIIAKSLPYWPINPGIYTTDSGPWYIFQLDLLRTAWMVLPAAFFWGASFPLAIAAVASRGQDPGRMVGGIYAANTIGAIAGSLGFSLWIVPTFGTQSAEATLIGIAALSAAIALAAHAFKRREDPADRRLDFSFSFRGASMAVVALPVLALLTASVSKVPWAMVAWGRFAATYIAYSEPEIVNQRRDRPKSTVPGQWHCTYLGEGMNVSVAVTESGSGSRFFHGAGKVQASSQPQDMKLQRMLGHLSALACKDPSRIRDVLVVACGAGVTAGSFITYPSIRRITVCDIEPLVPKVVAPMFGRENYHIVDGIDRANPHVVNGKEVSVIYDDGRHYIRTLPPDTKFDVITSDPIDPWVKGSAALNTIEFYEMCKRHLKPGGVMTLWMPLYESNLDSAKSMVATFLRVFPDGILFSNDQHHEGYDAVLLGQIQPSIIDVDHLQKLLDHPSYLPVKESLREVGFGSGEAGVMVDLLSTFAVQGSDLKPWMKNAQLNRDRNLRLQYLAGMYFNSYVSTKILQDILAHYRFPVNLFVGSNETLATLKQTLSYAGRREVD
ncbi:MAG: speE 2 [Acidobacteria bacterium]|nr:speE 2 [Acidobacteriota bacterium]